MNNGTFRVLRNGNLNENVCCGLNSLGNQRLDFVWHIAMGFIPNGQVAQILNHEAMNTENYSA